MVTPTLRNRWWAVCIPLKSHRSAGAMVLWARCLVVAWNACSCWRRVGLAVAALVCGSMGSGYPAILYTMYSSSHVMPRLPPSGLPACRHARIGICRRNLCVWMAVGYRARARGHCWMEMIWCRGRAVGGCWWALVGLPWTVSVLAVAVLERTGSSVATTTVGNVGEWAGVVGRFVVPL